MHQSVPTYGNGVLQSSLKPPRDLKYEGKIADDPDYQEFCKKYESADEVPIPLTLEKQLENLMLRERELHRKFRFELSIYRFLVAWKFDKTIAQKTPLLQHLNEQVALSEKNDAALSPGRSSSSKNAPSKKKKEKKKKAKQPLNIYAGTDTIQQTLHQPIQAKPKILTRNTSDSLSGNASEANGNLTNESVNKKDKSIALQSPLIQGTDVKSDGNVRSKKNNGSKINNDKDVKKVLDTKSSVSQPYDKNSKATRATVYYTTSKQV